MRVTAAVLLAAPLLLGLTPPGSRLDRLLVEARRDGGRYGCFADDPLIQGPSDAATVARDYAASRALRDDASARLFLSDLIDYTLEPSAERFAVARASLARAGSGAGAAEDLGRCVYHESGEVDRAALMATVEPPAIGLFWAARLRHERGHTARALDDYRRALADDGADPRTRLFYAIALIEEQQAGEALAVLDLVPGHWAPAPVAYWRARAHLDRGEAAAARDLLLPIKDGWKDAPTEPDASISRAPVQSRPPACLLAQALGRLGDVAGARSRLASRRECRGERAALELQEDRPFEALRENLTAFDGDAAARLRALSRLQACDWAWHDLTVWREQCGREDYRPSGCASMPEVEAEVVQACPAAPEAASEDDEALMLRLAAPRLVAFTEERVPARRRWRGKRPDEPRAAGGPPGLAPRTLVFLSPRAPRMFAVSLIEDVDPRGEVSSGGYWIHLGHDGGRTWRGPFYLGFAHRYPYVVQAASNVPAFAGGTVNIEVVRSDVDESTITFPPVGLPAVNVEKDLYLAVDLQAVERDTDRDGLTDLLEEKLALDPRAADTDADGLADGQDPLPLQPRLASESSDLARLLAAALPALLEGEEGLRGPAPTLFVTGAGAGLSHAAGVRAVTFSPRAFEEYTKKFGATFPLAMPDVAFDSDRRRALLRYHFMWRGGVLKAEREGGVWVVEEVRGWIT
jgi:hypothetical protein